MKLIHRKEGFYIIQCITLSHLISFIRGKKLHFKAKQLFNHNERLVIAGF